MTLNLISFYPKNFLEYLDNNTKPSDLEIKNLYNRFSK